MVIYVLLRLTFSTLNILLRLYLVHVDSAETIDLGHDLYPNPKLSLYQD